jgi:hypothetical protein
MAKTGPAKDHYDQQREGGQASDLERATTGHSAAARHEHWAAVAGAHAGDMARVDLYNDLNAPKAG